MWPELIKTKKNAENISLETEKLIRNHNTLYKKEIARHKDRLLADTDESIAAIEKEMEELRKNLESHRKQLETKAVFLLRHNKRI